MIGKLGLRITDRGTLDRLLRILDLELSKRVVRFGRDTLDHPFPIFKLETVAPPMCQSIGADRKLRYFSQQLRGM